MASPIAIVAPMLVSLGITPIMAVVAVAVGHAWAVTFGDMGVIFQTLASVVRQKNAAQFLGIDPRLLVSTQTAGGSLGSMLAPAKIIVGCSTVGLKGQDGQVLRVTLPVGVTIGIFLGLVALVITRL